MKLSRCSAVAALLIASGLTAQASYAAGLSITTSCKSLTPYPRAQISLKVVRTVDYDSRSARLEAEYSGSIQWDGETRTTQGKFSGVLPVSPAPVPELPKVFSVGQDSENVSMLIQKEGGTQVPFTATQMNMKLLVRSGVLGMGAQYVVLKVVMPTASSGTVAAIGNLYITNRSESSVTVPDSGSAVSLVCESRVRDL